VTDESANVVTIVAGIGDAQTTRNSRPSSVRP
jgi:hypothetical protein